MRCLRAPDVSCKQGRPPYWLYTLDALKYYICTAQEIAPLFETEKHGIKPLNAERSSRCTLKAPQNRKLRGHGGCGSVALLGSAKVQMRIVIVESMTAGLILGFGAWGVELILTWFNNMPKSATQDRKQDRRYVRLRLSTTLTSLN